MSNGCKVIQYKLCCAVKPQRRLAYPPRACWINVADQNLVPGAEITDALHTMCPDPPMQNSLVTLVSHWCHWRPESRMPSLPALRRNLPDDGSIWTARVVPCVPDTATSGHHAQVKASAKFRKGSRSRLWVYSFRASKELQLGRTAGQQAWRHRCTPRSCCKSSDCSSSSINRMY